MKTKRNFWMFFRRSTTAGLVVSLVLASSPPLAEADVWVRRDWSKVQAVAPGTKTTVLLYKDQAPKGKRKIEGHFHSATAKSITLNLPRSRSRTVAKKTVRQVLVYRPVGQRYQGWITLGVSGGVFFGSWAADAGEASEPLSAGAGALLAGLLVGVPTAIAFLVAPKMGGIYNVPPDRRDDDTQTPPKPGAGATVPEAKATGEESTGSRSVSRIPARETSADRFRRQARRAVMRRDLPLSLPDYSEL